MKRREALLATYFALCAAALVWPGYEVFGNGITPYVVGLPFSFAWNIGWILVTFAVLVTYHLTSGGEEQE